MGPQDAVRMWLLLPDGFTADIMADLSGYATVILLPRFLHGAYGTLIVDYVPGTAVAGGREGGRLPERGSFGLIVIV